LFAWKHLCTTERGILFVTTSLLCLWRLKKHTHQHKAIEEIQDLVVTCLLAGENWNSERNLLNERVKGWRRRSGHHAQGFDNTHSLSLSPLSLINLGVYVFFVSNSQAAIARPEKWLESHFVLSTTAEYLKKQMLHRNVFWGYYCLIYCKFLCVFAG
jgi:hypothetical protein